MVYKRQAIRDIWNIFVEDKGQPYGSIHWDKGQGKFKKKLRDKIIMCTITS